MATNNFTKLCALNVNDHKEDRDGLSYLSWAWAWQEFKKQMPDANYEIWRDEQGRPYIYDEDLGYMVFCKVTAEGTTHEMWLPVMDSKNKAMKNYAWEYSNKFGKKMIVNAATMFDVNKTIMRCLVKCMAMFGLGLYIYAGEDLPEPEEEVEAAPQKAKPKKIGKKEIGTIIAFCKANNINSDDLCQLYQVDSLEDVTEVKYQNMCAHWNDIIARIGGQK